MLVPEVLGLAKQLAGNLHLGLHAEGETASGSSPLKTSLDVEDCILENVLDLFLSGKLNKQIDQQCGKNKCQKDVHTIPPFLFCPGIVGVRAESPYQISEFEVQNA